MILAVVLLLLGFGFIIAEVFFVSFGALSLVAGTLIIAADVLAFQEGQVVGWAFVVAQVILIPVLVRLAFKVLPSLPFGREMMLTGPATDPQTGVLDLSHLVGHQGTALTDLNPSGTAAIDGDRLSVVAVGGAIPRDTTVVVLEVEGTEIKVRALGEPRDDAS
jgi:membrane-bound serine protease (ClpP class)